MQTWAKHLIEVSKWNRLTHSSKASDYRTTTIKQTQWKTPFEMACKEGQSDVVEQIANIQFKTISINLNAQHVNGMTHGKVIWHCLLPPIFWGSGRQRRRMEWSHWGQSIALMKSIFQLISTPPQTILTWLTFCPFMARSRACLTELRCQT